MARDYVPSTDGDFNSWQVHFLNYASANMVALGLVAGDFTEANSNQANWDIALPAHTAAQAAARGATQEKEARRADLENSIRVLARKISANPAVTPAHRVSLGLKPKDIEPSPVAQPESHPIAIVHTDQRLQHTIDFRDSATPNSRAKPEGMLGCEIWVSVLPVADAVPNDPATFAFLALDTATPYLAQYGGPDGGKNAHYILRWVSPRGDKGPWSETFSTTIGA